MEAPARIENSENRSRSNNVRLQGIPEATSGTDLKSTVITILNRVFDREASSPIELDQVHRVGGPRRDSSGRPWDVLWRVHYYTLKEDLIRKAWRMGPVDFDGASIHFCLNLSRNTLHMCPVVHPLLDLIHQARATYTWGHLFSIKVTSGNNNFVLSDPDQLPEFFLFLEQDPVDLLNWLASSNDRSMTAGMWPSPTTS